MFQRPSTPDINTDVVIIGAGPSGISAAKITQKQGLSTWVLGSHFESQIAKAGELKNVTKIPENTVGLDYIEVMVDEMKELGVSHKTSQCTKIEYESEGGMIIVHTKHQKIVTKYVIITTGKKQGKLNFKGELDFLHKGVSDCAVCDWGLFRQKKIAVVGNHLYTLRATEFLKNSAEKLYLLWYGEETDFNDSKVEVFSNVQSLEAYGSDVIEGVRFNHNNGNEDLEISGLFVEGKPFPSTEFLAESGINLDNDGHIVIDENYNTNIKNILAAGDVTGKSSTFDEAVTEGENAANQLLKLVA